MTTDTGSRAAVLERPLPPVRDRSAGPPLRRWALLARTGVPALVAYLLVQGLQLLLVRRWAPRFFWFDDSQAQFGPMAWWLGQHLERGRPPLMDPDLGMGGNVVADMQYGVLDPLHWAVHAAVASSDDLLAVSWAYGATTILLLGAGSLTVLLQYRVRPALAVAAAVGIGSSGFLVWYGSSWWPLLWATASLPWLWAGLRSRSAVGVLVTGLASWALMTSGNPYAFPFAGLLVVGQLVEYRAEHGSWAAALSAPRALSRAAACVGALVVALPTFLSTLQLSEVMGRQQPDPLVGNTGFGVPNLADVLLGGTTLLGQTNAWTGSVGLVPATATALVAVPAAALVDWRTAWRRSGVPTAGLVWLAAVVATQLPTTVAVFRYPLRYLVYVEVFLPLLVFVALAAAPRVSRRRVALAAGLALAQAALALSRAPVLVKWHLLGLAVALVALTALVVLLRARPTGEQRDDAPDRRGLPGHRSTPRPLPALAGVVLVLAVASGFPIGEQMMVAVQERADAIAGTPDSHGAPLRALDPGRDVGTTVAQYRAHSVAPDEQLTVVTWGFDPDRGWDDGVVNGSGNVLAGLEPGFASLAVWQAALNGHWCRTVWGATCSPPEALLAEAGDTGLPWLDLMSSDTVLLSTGAPEAVRAHFDQTWRQVAANDTWLRYQRADGLPGRVTGVAGDVVVSEEGWRSGPARAGEPMDSYLVSTGARGGRLATRIPYYPGMSATLDGRPLPVTPVDGAALAVELPPDVDAGRLELSYAPAGAGAVVPAAVAGAALIVLAALADAALRRRAGR
ncbi:hypothetical protein DQ238_14080 [Geodermatophilus sp. TF02-6]|uniref:hypothetical protein n=1 Tax=Geodermatophilus sp. TF02-6 TaxID=2250575 RepID=UPI000DE9FC62|nr:hypothetical protein [Geodermatophilus sp. TF02-6]RBY77789.1 hypothetical protein DQ238_14080 [Geodermatophilus sp. TF02-6]